MQTQRARWGSPPAKTVWVGAEEAHLSARTLRIYPASTADKPTGGLKTGNGNRQAPLALQVFNSMRTILRAEFSSAYTRSQPHGFRKGGMQHSDSGRQPGFPKPVFIATGPWWTAAHSETTLGYVHPCSTGARLPTPSLSFPSHRRPLKLSSRRQHAAAASTLRLPGPLAVRPWRRGAEQPCAHATHAAAATHSHSNCPSHPSPN